MKMAKFICVLILTQAASNGFWIWFSAPIKFADNPFPLIPIVSSIALVIMLVMWMVLNWDSK